MHSFNLKIFALLSITLMISSILGYYFICFNNSNEETRFFLQLIFSRVILLIYVLIGIASLIINRRAIFVPTFSAIPLAIIRIIFFGIFTIGGLIMFPQLIEKWTEMSLYAQSKNLPDIFSRAIWGIIPINIYTIKIAFIGLICSAFLALIGFKTKISILVFMLLSLYIFAIPNLTGKINHNHDLFWIPFLLIFSGSEDIFSFDSIIKNKKVILTNNLYPNKKYTIAVYSFWIMLGICYFFPGFWKIWNCGLDWALTNNVKYQIYDKWATLNEYIPLIRIDQYPIIYKTGGLFILWFEVSFIFFIAFKKTRFIGIVSGIIFHLATYATMSIFFIFFLIIYLAFIDYNKILLRQNEKPRLSEEKRNPQLSIASIFLYLGFIIYGILQIESWPYACYPRFDNLAKSYKYSVSVEHCISEGNCYYLDKTIVKKKYSPERLAFLENEIVSKNVYPLEKLNQLKELYVKSTSLEKIGEICFYKSRQPIHPDSLEFKENTFIQCLSVD